MLSAQNKELLQNAVFSIYDSQIIADYEFQTRLGVSRMALGEFLDQWSTIDLSDKDNAVILHNCCAELCYGVNVSDLFLQKYFGEARLSNLETIFLEWKRQLTFDPRDEQ